MTSAEITNNGFAGKYADVIIFQKKASFVKTSKITGTAEITVSVDKPAIFIYKVSTSVLKSTLSYSVKNRYGLAMSF